MGVHLLRPTAGDLVDIFHVSQHHDALIILLNVYIPPNILTLLFIFSFLYLTNNFKAFFFFLIKNSNTTQEYNLLNFSKYFFLARKWDFAIHVSRLKKNVEKKIVYAGRETAP